MGVTGFGKYKGQAFQETLQIDPEYCVWVLSVAEEPRASPAVRAFAAWLIEHIAELTVALEEHTPVTGILTFGKHKGKTFGDVLHLDPDYCMWALKTSEKDDDEQFQAFADFVK